MSISVRCLFDQCVYMSVNRSCQEFHSPITSSETPFEKFSKRANDAQSQFLPPANEAWGKVISLQASVCPQRGGVYLTRYTPWDQTSPRPDTSPGLSTPHPGLSNPLGLSTPPRTKYTPRCKIRSMCGRYASYWNAILFQVVSPFTLIFFPSIIGIIPVFH